jgi:prevent-host-death family protein
MKTVGAFEARTHLSELLDLTAMGERIIITRRGKAVAMLVPIEGAARTPAEAAATLRVLRRGVTLDGISTRELIEAGRR